MWRRLATAAGLAAVTARGAAAQTQYPDTTRLAREIPELLRASGVPGLSVAVVHSGRVVWSGAFGTVSDSARRRLDGGTVFEAASLSKPVFAYVVLRLADRGELDLDRPLFELLSTPGSRTTRAIGRSRPAWCSRTPRDCPTGAVTRSASVSIREPTTDTPARASSSSRRPSSGPPVCRSTRSRSVRCSGRSG